jgi:hypothetical protein
MGWITQEFQVDSQLSRDMFSSPHSPDQLQGLPSKSKAIPVTGREGP